jgi:hypothetical protein
VFYGLNNTSVNQAGTDADRQTAQTAAGQPRGASGHA